MQTSKCLVRWLSVHTALSRDSGSLLGAEAHARPISTPCTLSAQPCVCVCVVAGRHPLSHQHPARLPTQQPEVPGALRWGVALQHARNARPSTLPSSFPDQRAV